MNGETLNLDYLWQKYRKLILFLIIGLYPIVANPFSSPSFGLIKLTFLRVVLLPAVVLMLWKLFYGGGFRVPRSILWLPLILVLAAAIISTIFSVEKWTAIFGEYGRFEGLLTLFTYYLIFFIAAINKFENKDVNLFLIIFFSGAQIVSLLAIIEHFWLNPVLLSYGSFHHQLGGGSQYTSSRVMSTFGNPTFMAAYLVMVIPVSIAMLFQDFWSWKLKIFSGATFFLTALALVYSYTRGAWVGAVIGIIIVLYYSAKISEKGRYITIIIMVLSVLVLIVAIASSGKSFNPYDRLLSIFRFTSDSSIQRLDLYRNSLYLIKDKPITGTGPDAFKESFIPYSPIFNVQTYSRPKIDKSHSDLLQVATTQGIIGLLTYLWLHFVIFIEIIRNRSDSRKTNGINYFFIFIPSLIAFLVTIQFLFSDVSYSPVFWALAGLAVGLILNNNKRNSTVRLVVNWPKHFRDPVFIFFSFGMILLLIATCMFLAADTNYQKYLKAGKDINHNSKLIILKKATTFNPIEDTYWNHLGQEYANAGENSNSQDAYQKMIQLSFGAFDKARQLSPNNDNNYFNQANTLLRAGRILNNSQYLGQAVTLYLEGLKINSRSTDAYLNLGSAYVQLGYWDRAKKAWEKSLKLMPNNSESYYNLGWWYEHKKNYKKALGYYRLALRYNKDNKDAVEAIKRLERKNE